MKKYDKKASGLVVWIALASGVAAFAVIWLIVRVIEAATNQN